MNIHLKSGEILTADKITIDPVSKGRPTRLRIQEGQTVNVFDPDCIDYIMDAQTEDNERAQA